MIIISPKVFLKYIINVILLLISIFILFLSNSCTSFKENKNHLKRHLKVEIDSFKVVLPRYKLHSDALIEKLDSLICKINKYDKLKSGKPNFPIYITVSSSSVNKDSTYYVFTGKKGYMFDFFIPANDFQHAGESNLGGLYFKGYLVKFNGHLEEYKLGKNNPSNYLISPTKDSITFYVYGEKNIKDGHWPISLYPFVRDYSLYKRDSFFHYLTVYN